MTQQDPDARSPAWQEAGAALADELRGITEALAVRELRREDLLEAAELARALRRRLEGPRRTRWYDGVGQAEWLSEAAREAYLHQSPIRGELNPIAPPLALETVTRADGSRAIVGRTRLGMGYEGPPHGVHGGWVAALFDELLGAVSGLAERPGVTATLKVRFRHITPIGEDLRFEGWIHDQRTRRLVARATCHASETLTADAEGVFVGVDFNEVQERMLERRAERPEE
jgi:acyl-coenzyme A thioesterase PaaI-like protein